MLFRRTGGPGTAPTPAAHASERDDYDRLDGGGEEDRGHDDSAEDSVKGNAGKLPRRAVILGVVFGVIIGVIFVSLIPNPLASLFRSVASNSKAPQPLAASVSAETPVPASPSAAPSPPPTPSATPTPTPVFLKAAPPAPLQTPRNIVMRSESHEVEEVDVASAGPDPPANFSLPESKASSVPDWDFDIVYLWVNGSDPQRLENKFKYLHVRGVTDRDRDNGELRYSLRSLDKFLPWWNGTLYIVSTETPCWANLQNPRLKFIHHNQIFIDQAGTLPSFSSQAIEPNIFRIPGLRKHFLLTNDDVFFGAPLEPSDFFRNGNAVLRFEKWAVQGGLAAASRVGPPSQWRASMFISRGMLEERFRLREAAPPPPNVHPLVFHYLKHTPAALDRDRVERLWTLFPKRFYAVTHSRTRSYEGFHMAFVHHSLCLLEHDDCVALNQDVSDREAVFLTTGTNWNVLSANLEPIRNQQYKFWNLNDEQDMGSRFQTNSIRTYEEFLPSVFPTPSQYETSACPQRKTKIWWK